MKTKRIPFDLEKAKAGAKVVTRDGLPVKIVDYPIKNEDCPILGLVLIEGKEFPLIFTKTGNHYNNSESCYDLSIEEEVEEDDSDYDPYKATVESIADMVERYSELQSIEELKDFYNNVKIKCRDAFEYGKVCMINLDEEPDDNKPKFHKGDWVIDKQGMVQKITNVIENVTNHTYGYDTISYSLGFISYGYFSGIKKDIRLWDIKDSKDGDVLCSTGLHNDCIFIFNGLDNWKFDAEGDRAVATGYCCLFITADKMEFGIQGPDCIEVNTIKPATKEQRELLFKKMKEAGYEWDSDKKELHKIGKVKTRRMTNQELSWWLRDCQQERREVCRVDEDTIYSRYIYRKCDANEEVPEFVRIRKNGGEWQEPLIEKKVETRAMTNQELADWLRQCPEEHREFKYTGCDCVYSSYDYLESSENSPVERKLIRRNHGEWQEPLIEMED